MISPVPRIKHVGISVVKHMNIHTKYIHEQSHINSGQVVPQKSFFLSFWFLEIF